MSFFSIATFLVKTTKCIRDQSDYFPGTLDWEFPNAGKSLETPSLVFFKRCSIGPKKKISDASSLVEEYISINLFGNPEWISDVPVGTFAQWRTLDSSAVLFKSKSLKGKSRALVFRGKHFIFKIIQHDEFHVCPVRFPQKALGVDFHSTMNLTGDNWWVLVKESSKSWWAVIAFAGWHHFGELLKKAKEKVSVIA